MELKLKNGKTFKLKKITLDERNELLDSVNWIYDKDGMPVRVDMMYTTLTKWLRMCLKNISDEVIMDMSVEEQTEIYKKLQDILTLGKENASK
tara:strand:- start:164 stop:442 length:279 start_codon:yes stop_codon:yes gene_type:complete